MTCAGWRDKLPRDRLANESMTTSNHDSAGTTPGEPDVLVHVDDYEFHSGWDSPATASARARQCCEQLEEGRILFFDRMPFVFFKEDREFLLSQRQSGSRLHKNISYRPLENVLHGASGSPEENGRLLEIMERFSNEVTRFLGRLLEPYAEHWALDYASFRPEEEQGRKLPVHKRNDLLHLDAFPTRPMNGHRILRCFTNINPSAARVWNTTDGFSVLASLYAEKAGLAGFAAKGSPRTNPLVRRIKSAFGLKAVDPSAYDRFMLRFHDYLKEESEFQKSCRKIRLEFPPGSTWVCYTDAVPHAVLSGRYALEQTFIIPLPALVTPEKAPINVLEKMAGAPLADRA
ncbi:MAG: Kdo hydroxylase family protein [Verrucomicrobiota bacterium]